MLWALNLADAFQTIYMKDSGLLGHEANQFINFFLQESNLYFFSAKVLALILISSVLIRGWASAKGMNFGNTRYNQHQTRQAINFLLAVGVVYYIIIVGFPFVAMLLMGYFHPIPPPPA